jgi:coenzyme F420-reducing hydrogenase delta subunit
MMGFNHHFSLSFGEGSEGVHQGLNVIAEVKTGCGKRFEASEIVKLEGCVRCSASELVGDRKVVVLACRWRYFAGVDLPALKELVHHAECRFVRTPCAGMISTQVVSAALEEGADAVLIMGGHPHFCPLRERQRNEEVLREQISHEGFNPDRLVFDWADEDSFYRLSSKVERIISIDHTVSPQ